MSELNDAIRPWLLANGFEEYDETDNWMADFYWDNIYYNDDYNLYILFDNHYETIRAYSCNGETHIPLDDATANEVIAYFTKYGNIPQESSINTAPNTATTTQQADYKPQTGWQCPCCGVCHAPWVSSCNCRGYNGAGGGIPSVGAPVQQQCSICGGIHYWGMHCITTINRN
jgi:hypothetical protein